MKEWHRTVLLIVLLTMAVGFVLWLNNGMENAAEHVLQ